MNNNTDNSIVGYDNLISVKQVENFFCIFISNSVNHSSPYVIKELKRIQYTVRTSFG